MMSRKQKKKEKKLAEEVQNKEIMPKSEELTGNNGPSFIRKIREKIARTVRSVASKQYQRRTRNESHEELLRRERHRRNYRSSREQVVTKE